MFLVAIGRWGYLMVPIVPSGAVELTLFREPSGPMPEAERKGGGWCPNWWEICSFRGFQMLSRLNFTNLTRSLRTRKGYDEVVLIVVVMIMIIIIIILLLLLLLLLIIIIINGKIIYGKVSGLGRSCYVGKISIWPSRGAAPRCRNAQGEPRQIDG